MLLTSFPAGTASAQQVPVQYQIERIPVADDIGSYDINNWSMVVGAHTPNGSNLRVGYIYDHLGIIGAARTIHSLDEWIPNLDGWSSAVCTGINDAGQVVGLLKATVDNATVGKGFYLDLDIFSVSPMPTWQYLPAPPDSTYFYGWRINNAGDIIVPFLQDNVRRAYLYNPNDPGTDYEVLSDPATELPLSLDSLSVALNNSRQVVGKLGTNEGFRLTPRSTLEIIPFSMFDKITINDSGTVAFTFRTEMPSSKGNKTHQVNVAARFDVQGDIQLLTDQRSVSMDINQSGDVGIKVDNSDIPPGPYLYHANTSEEVGYGFLSLDDLVVGTEDDIAFWSEAISEIRAMNNRDETTGFGQIVVKSKVFSITGKGKDRARTYEYRHFLLTPALLQ